MNTNGSISFIGVIGVILLVLAGMAGIVILLRKFDWWVGEICEQWIAKAPDERRARAAVYFSMVAFISAIIGVTVTLVALKYPYPFHPRSTDTGLRLIALFFVIFSVWTYSFCHSIKLGFRITPPTLRWTSWVNASVIMMSTFSLLFCILLTLMANPRRYSNIAAARTSIRSICNALDCYEIEIGRYPTEEQGLAVLINSHRRNEKTLYLERLPLSPWGEPFIYRLENGKPVVSARKPDGGIISN